MEPVDFLEKVIDLQKPPSMTDEECTPLPVWTDGTECISKWKMSFSERLHCLFFGFVWLRVVFGRTQPPVMVEATNDMFKKEK